MLNFPYNLTEKANKSKVQIFFIFSGVFTEVSGFDIIQRDN